jgi:hypothetical protein
MKIVDLNGAVIGEIPVARIVTGLPARLCGTASSRSGTGPGWEAISTSWPREPTFQKWIGTFSTDARTALRLPHRASDRTRHWSEIHASSYH